MPLKSSAQAGLAKPTAVAPTRVATATVRSILMLPLAGLNAWPLQAILTFSD